VAALGSTVGTGRPRFQSPEQERQVLRGVNGCDPRQYGLDFGLWTHAVVADLFERKFGVRLSVTSAVALLERLGLSAQRPQQRVYQRGSQAIERWQRKHYPRIALPARRDGTEILFWDLIRLFFMAPSVANEFER
jgi:transposase